MKSKKFLFPLLTICVIPFLGACKNASKSISVTEEEYNEALKTIIDDQKFVVTVNGLSVKDGFNLPISISDTFAVEPNVESSYIGTQSSIYTYKYSNIIKDSHWKKIQYYEKSKENFTVLKTLEKRELYFLFDCLEFARGKYKECQFKKLELDDDGDLYYTIKGSDYTLSGKEYDVNVCMKFYISTTKKEDKPVIKPYISSVVLDFITKGSDNDHLFKYTFDFLSNSTLKTVLPSADKIIEFGEISKDTWENAIDKLIKSPTSARNFALEITNNNTTEILEFNEPYERTSKTFNGVTTIEKIAKDEGNGVVNVVYPSNPDIITFDKSYINKTRTEYLVGSLSHVKNSFATATYDQSKKTYTVNYTDGGNEHKYILGFDTTSNTIRTVSHTAYGDCTIYNYGAVEKISFPENARYSQDVSISSEVWSVFLSTLLGAQNYFCEYSQTIDGEKQGEYDKSIFEMNGGDIHVMRFYNNGGTEVGHPVYYKRSWDKGEYNFYSEYIYKDGKYEINKTTHIDNHFTTKLFSKIFSNKDDFTYNATEDKYSLNKNKLTKYDYKAFDVKITENGDLNIELTTMIESKESIEKYRYHKYGQGGDISMPEENI